MKGLAMPLSPDQQAEIDAQRAQSQSTLRATAAGMEQPIRCLITALSG